jgi:hypothetical protein
MTDAASPVIYEPIQSERELLQALRARREQLQLTYESISAVGGMPDQYPSRLLSGARGMGMLSLFILLQTFGLKIQLVEDSVALERNQRHSGWQTPKEGVSVPDHRSGSHGPACHRMGCGPEGAEAHAGRYGSAARPQGV